MQNFIALDLELTQPTRKIIQVGVCIGNQDNEKEWVVKKWFIDPEEPISQDIFALTGISDSDISQFSQPLQEIADELSALITEHQCFVNPITWGAGDSAELLELFHSNNIPFKHFGRRWLDVKTMHTFLKLSKNKTGNSASGGLASCMGQYKLQFSGKAHRADIDAFNTLKFYFHLIKRQQILEQALISLKTIV